MNVYAKHVASLYKNSLLSFISSSHNVHRKIRREPAEELLAELQGKLGVIPAGHQDGSGAASFELRSLVSVKVLFGPV